MYKQRGTIPELLAQLWKETCGLITLYIVQWLDWEQSAVIVGNGILCNTEKPLQKMTQKNDDSMKFEYHRSEKSALIRPL